MKSLLVVDDEKAIRDSLKMILQYEKYEVHFAADANEALKLLDTETPVDLVLLDIKMPGMDGLKALELIKSSNADLPVVMISGHGTIDTAVEATKLGAFDFLQKPLDRDRLLIVIRNGLAQRRLIDENKAMKEQVEGKYDILGSSETTKELIGLIERVAATPARVLITGENGVGKELVARGLHSNSPLRSKPFVEVNCAAIPNELIESELFGHEKGSFTGATSQRIGKFEMADGGTLFLDEVGDMSLAAQAKVLRALEEGKIERVGGNKQIEVSVRVIAATNKNLLDAIKNNLFREDLYHRLNVIPILVPPLRERRDDIPILAEAFASEICLRYGMPQKTFSADSLQRLKGMDWPGNVRELKNIVERLIIMSKTQIIEAVQIDTQAGSVPTRADDLLNLGGTFQEFKDHAEAAFIKKQLEEHGWNISRTADALSIQRSHLYNKIKKFGLSREEAERG